MKKRRTAFCLFLPPMILSASMVFAAGGNNCSGLEAKSDAAALKHSNCKEELFKKYAAKVPKRFLTEHEATCDRLGKAANEARKDVVRCKQEGLGMTPRRYEGMAR